MKRRSEKFWIRASNRRLISLLVTVIWLATALQPCVMASVVDSNASNVASHHFSQNQNDQADDDRSHCPRCITATSGNDRCAPQNGTGCDEQESFMSFERVKPVDHEKFDQQTQALSLLAIRGYETSSYRLPDSTLSKSLYLPAGPALTHLYQVYLK